MSKRVGGPEFFFFTFLKSFRTKLNQGERDRELIKLETIKKKKIEKKLFLNLLFVTYVCNVFLQHTFFNVSPTIGSSSIQISLCC
jgi:hypothetical protein